MFFSNWQELWNFVEFLFRQTSASSVQRSLTVQYLIYCNAKFSILNVDNTVAEFSRVVAAIDGGSTAAEGDKCPSGGGTGEIIPLTIW